MMNKEKAKQIIISILIGAGVAFFSTLFEQLALFIKSHGTEIMSGAATSLYHISRKVKFT